MRKSSNLTRLKAYLLRHKRNLILAVFFSAGTNLLALLIPYVLRYTIDDLKTLMNKETLLLYALLIVSISIMAGFFRFLMTRRLMGVAFQIEYELRNDLFSHLQKLSLSYFHKTKTGDIMARATNDLKAVRMLVGPGIRNLLNTIIMGSAAIILMLIIDYKLTLYSLIPLPVLTIAVTIFSSRIFYRFQKVQEQFSSISVGVQENLTGIRVVKAYVQEGNEKRKFKQLNQDYMDKNISLVKIWGLFFPFIMLIAGIGMVIVLWLGGRLVMVGKISLGQFVQFNGYLMMLTWPMMALGWAINLVQRGSASMGRLIEILDQAPEIKDSEYLEDIRTLEGEIEFKNVSFAYDKKVILKNIDLKIPKGITIGIIGPTGSGKSTLVNLIPRLLEVREGSLTIDGMEIKSIPLKILRKNIGYVPQETFLFSESLKENIIYGLEDFDEAKLRRAVSISALSDEIERFSQRYETPVGERGVTLSGGQKQRTALSRAIIREPKILILDDAFSSVDVHTEEKILKQLRKFRKRRTCILVSHRTSTIEDADWIVVLKDGRIVEQGTHEELVARSGIYTDIWLQQQLREELEKIA
ncbi:MAG: ATP-binding cassette domain-containing protein [Firmicutes bacterium]|nr:ATP-binding cassette domain-containing protein [Bacillota bacterium]